MSNHPRRRHLHTPRENRTRRAIAMHEQGKFPCVPGVIPDREQASLDEAMAQAHHVLPYIPGTQVNVRVFELLPGLAMVLNLFGEGAVVQVQNLLLARGGSDPAIVISSRERHEEECDHG